MVVVRYADDAVLGFEHRKDAEVFLEQLCNGSRYFPLKLSSYFPAGWSDY